MYDEHTYYGSLEYEDYRQMGDIFLETKIQNITTPNDLVDVINVYVPDGAELNNAGEVVLLKNIDYENFGITSYPAIPIRTDITIIGKEDNAINHGFTMDIENSSLISENALQCGIYANNSTICFRQSDYPYTANISIFTEGNVVFKGIYEDIDTHNCLRNNQILLNVGVNANLDDMANSNITFEDLELWPSYFIVKPSTTINFKDCRWYIPSEVFERDHLILRGGNVNIDNCVFGDYESNKDVTFTVESGNLKINRSQSHNIIIKGKDANVEINSGLFQAFTIQDGNVEVNNGYFPHGIAMEGGSLKVNDGKVALLDVGSEKCDITLNNGLLGGIKIPSKVNKSIWDMLGHGAGYYDRDGTYMPYKLESIKGNDETTGSIIVGTTYPVSLVLNNYSTTPTPAFTAAQQASVGPDGSDIKVRANGDLEILTAEGLAWLAFMCGDTHERVLTGRNYYTQSKDWYLMSDLDMDGYGEFWPKLNVVGRTFHGQQHRIYNMNISRPDPSFINMVSEGAVVRDLIVEGSITNLNDEGGRFPQSANEHVTYTTSGFVNVNNGLLVNCAFKGEVWNTALGKLNMSGFANNNNGRIENCYMSPCNEIVGGARYANDNFGNEYVCMPYENYRGGGFVFRNSYNESEPENAIIYNCYFGGQVSYGTNVPNNENISIIFRHGVFDSNGYPCDRLYHTDADISAEMLNNNILEHTPEMYEGTSYPYIEWAKWAESDDKQCGRPYFVWEKNLADTPSGVDNIEAEGGFKAWNENGTLCFSSNRKINVSIYSINGKLYARYNGHIGTKRIAALPEGIYIVTCGNMSKKVVL